MTAVATRNGTTAPVDVELAEATFPVGSFRDAAIHLRRPFTERAVRFKLQTATPKEAPVRGLVVCYIDARLAIERLNHVCPQLWHDEYEPLPDSLLMCRLTVDGISRIDVGSGAQFGTEHRGKGAYSDAFKRAAVKFGVGVSLYAVPKMWLNKTDGHLKDSNSRAGKSLVLTDAGELRCRELYAQWLMTAGTQAFGEPLDHGDVADSAGDLEVGAPEMETPRPDRRTRDVALTTPAGVDDLGPDAAQFRLTTLITKEHPLREKRAEAQKGMGLLGAPVAQQVRELDAAADERTLDGLISRIDAALDAQAKP